MPVRADAHLHFFKPGYAAVLPESCRRMEPDEVTLYGALARQYEIDQVLAVGYERESWTGSNNQYLAGLAAHHTWLRPVAYVHDPAHLDEAMLENWQKNRFVGLSIYLFSEPETAALGQVKAEVWHRLVDRRWLVSVNSRGEHWAAWRPILARYPDLRLLVSHLGLPPAVEQTPAMGEARQGLETVLTLAEFPGVHVKLSGFYALTQPGYAYPHPAAWPYVEALLVAFGADRLLWGSDFSPSLEWLSFPQTFGLLARMPFLDAAAISRIEGANLLALLAEVTE